MTRRRQIFAEQTKLAEQKKQEETILAQAFKEAGLDVTFVDCKKCDDEPEKPACVSSTTNKIKGKKR